MTSPSEPVESREQPREWPIRWVNDQKLDDLHALWHDQPGNMMGERECGWEHCEFWIMAQFTLDVALPVELHHRLADRDASIRNLETLRDVHRRTIDDLISEAQTAGATIDELRAEVERRMKPWQDRDIYATMTRAEPAMRYEAFADAARLREQAEAVRRLADQIEVEIAPFHSDDETVVDRIRAALGDAREGE